MPIWRTAALTACLLLACATTPALKYPSHEYPSLAHSIRLADARPPRATGKIIVLYPRTVDAQALAIPGGEPAGELHLTLVDFGYDLKGVDDTPLQQRLADLTGADTHPIQAQVFGHAILNPQTGESDTPVVYLVGDCPDLTPLRDQVVELAQQVVQLPDQHEPWIPHITAAYGSSDAVLTYTGPVVFDRIGLVWEGRTTYFPLGVPRS
jgi:hypothetical protein